MEYNLDNLRATDSTSNLYDNNVSPQVKIEQDLYQDDIKYNRPYGVKEEYDEPLMNCPLSEETDIKQEFGISYGMEYSLNMTSKNEDLIGQHYVK
jgi:hypothetical protein